MDRGAWQATFYGVTRVRYNWVTNIPEWASGFPYFLQFKSEFDNKESRIWATVSPQSCFCWLYRAYYRAAKNIINLLSVLTIWWCLCVESSLVLLEEGACYDQCVLLAKLCRLWLVLQGQICLLFQVCLDFLLLKCFLLFLLFRKFSFLIGGWLLYNVVLVSATQQSESAINIHMFHSSWTSFSPPSQHTPKLNFWFILEYSWFTMLC